MQRVRRYSHSEERIMFGESAMVGGMVVWILWFGLSLIAFLSFLRGMRALVQIAERLERIERVMAGQGRSTSNAG
jgi:uncharacterized membrane protein